jgi:hypothetical protein
MFASLYREMAKVGMPNPREVDRLLVWECAVLLGVGEESSDDAMKRDPHAHLRADLAYRQARAAWEAGEGPPPDPSLKFQWGDATVEEQELMSVLASGTSFG